MRELYIETGRVVPPTTQPDTDVPVSFIAAPDGKYTFSRGHLFRQRLVPTKTISHPKAILGAKAVIGDAVWSRREEVDRLPPVHIPISGRRREWRVNKRLLYVCEEIGVSQRCYWRTTYDIDDPSLAEVLRPYVRQAEE
jgi:hypothetical protein